MKIAATYNIKGGVGKTATAVNLAWLAAQSGARTLVWDLDPQGAATFYFRVKPRVKGGGKKLLKGKGELGAAIKGTDFDNLDIIPADFSYRHLDIHLDRKKNPTAKLKKLLSTVEDDYDLIILDCPPSISLVSESVFAAADALLIPIIPTTLSLRTLEQLDSFREENELSSVEFLVFFSMVDRRRKLHVKLIEEVRASRPAVLNAAIPSSSEIERMGEHRSPVGAWTKGAAAKAYEELWAEVRKALFGRKNWASK